MLLFLYCRIISYVIIVKKYFLFKITLMECHETRLFYPKRNNRNNLPGFSSLTHYKSNDAFKCLRAIFIPC